MFNFFRPNFETSVRRELPMLYRVARRLTSSAEDAEDLVSQTLVSAYRGWHTFDGKYLRSWLVRILRNERGALSSEKNLMAEIEDLAEHPDDYTTWDHVAAKFESEDIRREIDLLPLHFKLPVLLCDVEQLSYEEASQALDIPIGTVRSRLNRGRNQLKRKLFHWTREEIRP